MSDEIWKPCLTHPQYEVSSIGRVRSVTGRIKHYSKEKGGRTRAYLRVQLYGIQGQRHAYVHVLVCESFHGAKPDQYMQACHDNDVSTDNRAENLYWGTREENDDDRYVKNAADAQLEQAAF